MRERGIKDIGKAPHTVYHRRAFEDVMVAICPDLNTAATLAQKLSGLGAETFVIGVTTVEETHNIQSRMLVW